MDPQVKAKLLEINQVFYDRYARSFSATRHQVQPGVGRLLGELLSDDSILDVGCGNGTLAQALAAQGYSGDYLGIDISPNLLDEAKTRLGSPPIGAYQFQQADLALPHWHKPFRDGSYNGLVAFAVLHHLPGEKLRLQTVRTFKELIAPDGHIVVSVWQWQNSTRLRKRVLPWSTVGLHPDQLDEGDALLDWRAGETPGLRYVHTFNADSLTTLATQAGLQVCRSYFSDGKTGNLALYQVWRVDQG
jgi:SAM-dependent methyltransferase